jgi:hypothetical protein
MLDLEKTVDANRKRYMREFLTSMAGYTVMVPLSIWMLRGHEHTPVGYALAFLPIIPSAFAIWAFMRFFRGLDELQRRIQLEAVAFSFLATCLITLTWAFQQNAGLPRFDVGWVAPLLIALWGIGVGIAKRRYE